MKRERGPVVALCVLLVAACGGEWNGPKLAPGRVLRTASRCPPRLGHGPFVSSGGDLTGRLVPAGANSARLCAYAGLNPSPRRAGRLVAERSVNDARVLAKLASTLNGLPAPQHGAGSCPGRDRGAFVVLFAYPSRSVVAVTVNVPGTCFLVSNGHKVKSAALAPPDRMLRAVLHGTQS